VDEEQKERAQKLVNELKDAGLNSGLLIVQGTVVLRSPGAPYSDAPILFFDESDLQNAIELSLLEERKVVGSYEWEWYVVANCDRDEPQ
jgi:hypothetical protein